MAKKQNHGKGGGGNAHQRAMDRNPPSIDRREQEKSIETVQATGWDLPSEAPQLDLNHFNRGDSVGVVALIVTVLAVVLTPPLWIKIPMLFAACIGCVFFTRRSHWTYKWPRRGQFVTALLIVVVIVVVGVPQFIAQWKVEHSKTNTVALNAEHTHLNFIAPMDVRTSPLAPIRIGRQPTFNIGFNNKGDFPILESSLYVKVLVVSQYEGSHDVFEHHAREITSQEPNISGTLNAHTPTIVFHTFRGEPLTREQVQEMTNGRDAVCAVGIADWKDNSGRYETQLHACLMYEEGNLAWHFGPAHNIERRKN